MGVYVFSKKALLPLAVDEDRVDFGAHVIPAMLDGGARVFGYRFNGYWQDVGTIQRSGRPTWRCSTTIPELDLYDQDWVIHTRSEERAPAKIGADRPGPPQPHQPRLRDRRDGRATRSCRPACASTSGAVVRDSIVMFDSVIRSGAVVDRAIIDKEVVGRAGRGRRRRPDRRHARTRRSRAGSTPASRSSASGR